MLTMTDAKNAATVRRALNECVTGHGEIVLFGQCGGVEAFLNDDGFWDVYMGDEMMPGCTTDQAVEAITEWARA